jgi:hypothetical protein
MNEETRAFLAARVSPERRRQIAEWFEQAPDVDEFATVPMSECTQDHRAPAGPNEDLSQCPDCWGITWALRPYGESFGWHLDDCSLPLRHEGYCVGGGEGHVMPDGWKLRG